MDQPAARSVPPEPSADAHGDRPPAAASTGDPELLATVGPDRLQQGLVQAQKMEALGQLVSGVAHELNNPLSAIIAFSQLIGRDPRLPDDLRHDADVLVQEAERTRRIVQNLLDFARRRPPERHPTPLHALVTSILDLQTYHLAAGQIEVQVDIPDDVPPVPLDRSQMQQVLLNLTFNAIQAVRAHRRGGHLTIRARVDPDAAPATVRILVADDGPGVPPDNRDRLFVPFFTTKSAREGTGLGLPISLEIVAAHGGRLTYEPAEGGGACFVVELPLAPPKGPDEPAAGATAQGRSGSTRPAAGGGRGRPQVLVLDDEPSIRRFLGKALEIAGCDATIAERGEEALELIRGLPFDAVLCDHRMAGMTGTEVYDAAIRIRPELSDRFVFMSGDVLNPQLREFAETRRLGLLAKPFDIDSVGKAIRAIVDRNAQAR